MKAFKKTLALLLVAVMVLSLSAVAFAGTRQTETYGSAGHPLVQDDQATPADIPAADGQIIIGNAQKDRTYHAIRLFDSDGAGDKVIYTLPAGKTDLKVTGSFEIENPAYVAGGTEPEFITVTEIDGADWFDLDTSDPKKVTAKKDAGGNTILNDNEFQTKKFVLWAQAFGKEIISAKADPAGASTVSQSGNNNALVFDKLPLGYYMIVVDPDGTEPTQPDPNDPNIPWFRGLVTLDTTNKTAEVEDKNDTPHWNTEYGKRIADEDKADAPNGSYGIEEKIPYEVSIGTLNYNNEKLVDGKPAKIYNYYVYDSIDSRFMTYVEAPTVTVAGTPISSDVRYTYFTVPYEEIQDWLTANPDATWDDVLNAKDASNNLLFPTTDRLGDAKSFRLDIRWVEKNWDKPFVDAFNNDTGAAGADGLYDKYDHNTAADATYTGQNAEEFYGASLYANGSALVVNYAAKLDKVKVEAALAADPNALENLNYRNKAGFSWYDQTMDPNKFQPQDPTKIPPEQIAKNYTVDLIVYKVDKENNPLAGAKFKLVGTGTTITRIERDEFVDHDGSTAPKYWELTDGNYTPNDPDTRWQAGQESEPGFTAVGELRYDQTLYVDVTKPLMKTTTVELLEETSTTGLEQATSGADQHAVWGTLAAGLYTLEETVAPEGYNAISPKTIRIVFHDPNGPQPTWTAEDVAVDPTRVLGAKKPTFEGYEVAYQMVGGVQKEIRAPGGLKFEYTEGTETVYEIDTNGKLVVKTQGTAAKLEANVENRAGNELPATGGIGTTIFYVVGAVLMVGAGVVLFTRKRVGYEAE